MSVSGKNMTLAMINPKDIVAVNDLEFLLGFSIQPVLVLQSQMEKALKLLEAKSGTIDPSSQSLTAEQSKESIEYAPRLF